MDDYPIIILRVRDFTRRRSVFSHLGMMGLLWKWEVNVQGVCGCSGEGGIYGDRFPTLFLFLCAISDFIRKMEESESHGLWQLRSDGIGACQYISSCWWVSYVGSAVGGIMNVKVRYISGSSPLRELLSAHVVPRVLRSWLDLQIAISRFYTFTFSLLDTCQSPL